MSKHFVVIGLCLAMVFSTVDVSAQVTTPVNQSWDVLRQLSIGESLRVERKDGKKSSGKLAGSSDTELVLARGGKAINFNRNDVKNIWMVAPPSRTKKAIFGGLGFTGGLIAGMAIGVSLGFKDCGGGCADEGAGIVAAMVGLPAAGLIGGRALARGKRTLIYSAP